MRKHCLLLCATLLGCDPKPPKEATLSELQTIFSRSCIFRSCHESALPQYGNLKLSGADAYCQLTGPTAGATFRAAAKDMLPRRVVPRDRQQSFLYRKLALTDEEHGPAKPLGSRMPLGSMLEKDEIDLFGRWIDAGAQNDDPAATPCM